LALALTHQQSSSPPSRSQDEECDRPDPSCPLP
jgi:hypothetical protein